ncbi:MAG TPA: TIGR00341 family protein [Cytophagales bacterium]|nr:TIGR00341 family protein [Cytophagales bacterium]HCR54593.1 TIGR00341 family protein [Cytophagales bacterium]
MEQKPKVNETPPRKTLVKTLRQLLSYQFNLDFDKSQEDQIVDDIRRSVEFRGMNLWVLIFAIFIASIGLNMNSTAVVIGAMLISPLMGPIIGLGVGVGINDFDLIKRALRNVGVATIISLIASTIYFLITPLSEASSELLARTTPTIWDVFIAFFGGLAGIIAYTNKQKGNVIPGVAIATALMPPLCTAGYGIASGNLSFFMGAFYLYFINSIFIAIATYLMVKYQRFSLYNFVDAHTEKRVRRSIAIVVILTIGPSIFMGYQIVTKSLYERSAINFINQEFDFPDTQIVNSSIDGKERKIEVLLFGEKLDDDQLALIKDKMAMYGLTETELRIRQDIDKSDPIDYNAIKTGVLEDLYKNTEQSLRQRERIIDSLQGELDKLKPVVWPIKSMTEELSIVVSPVDELSIFPSVFYSVEKNKYDTALTAYLKMQRKPSKSQTEKIESWLKARTQNDSIRIIMH